MRWKFPIVILLISLILLILAITEPKQNVLSGFENSVEVSTYNIDNVKDRKKLLEIATVIKDAGLSDILLLQEVYGEFAVSIIADRLGIPYSS